jgi:hypothetical protein
MRTHYSDFSLTELSSYLIRFPAAVFEIQLSSTPEYLGDLVRFLQSTVAGERKFCLVSYQGHWMALDIHKKDATSTLSIVCLDAANNIHRVAGLLHLLEKMGMTPTSFQFLHLCSQTPLQRDSNTCAAFAIELLRFSSLNPNFHDDLVVLTSKHESRRELVKYMGAIRLLRNGEASLGLLDSYTKKNLLLINYDKLIESDIEKWAGFFLNSQALVRHPRIDDLVEKWLIERRSPSGGEYVMHNLRIDYQSHLIRAEINHLTPKTEDEFILEAICKIHGEVFESAKLGLVLRKAIVDGLLSHVKALLNFSAVDINECPPSRNTALDRALGLPDRSPVKSEILELLRARGAISGRSLSGSLFTRQEARDEARVQEASSHP